MTPNSLRILLLVKINVENSDAIVRFVKRVALSILEITYTKDLPDSHSYQLLFFLVFAD